MEPSENKTVIEYFLSFKSAEVLQETWVFFILLFVTSIFGSHLLSQGALFYRGVTTTAYIVETDDSSGYADDPQCYFKYRFEAAGRTVLVEGTDTFCPGNPGDSLEVVFDPSNPSNSIPEDYYFQRQFLAKAMVFLGLLGVLLGSAFFWTIAAWDATLSKNNIGRNRAPRSFLIFLFLITLLTALGHEGLLNLHPKYALFVAVSCLVGLLIERKLFEKFCSSRKSES